MQIENGRFYFINDDFINKYGKKYNLMKNKETRNKRPYFFCFRDKKDSNIIWFVPVSRQYQKYKDIYDKKKQNMKNNRVPLNFVFGIVRDSKSVFLIQNMFPTLEKYILGKYKLDTANDVRVTGYLRNKVVKTAELVLNLSQNKNIRIAFSDLNEFKQELLNEDK